MPPVESGACVVIESWTQQPSPNGFVLPTVFAVLKILPVYKPWID